MSNQPFFSVALCRFATPRSTRFFVGAHVVLYLTKSTRWLTLGLTRQRPKAKHALIRSSSPLVRGTKQGAVTPPRTRRNEGLIKDQILVSTGGGRSCPNIKVVVGEMRLWRYRRHLLFLGVDPPSLAYMYTMMCSDLQSSY